jgi:hypothetical protein
LCKKKQLKNNHLRVFLRLAAQQLPAKAGFIKPVDFSGLDFLGLARD